MSLAFFAVGEVVFDCGVEVVVFYSASSVLV